MNIAALQRDLATKKTAIAALIERTATAAEAENREWSAEERAAIDKEMEDARTLRARIDRAQGDENMIAALGKLTDGLVPHVEGGGALVARGVPVVDAVPVYESLGDQFVNNPDYHEFIKRHGHRRSGAWISPGIEFMGATLTEDVASGGKLVQPQVLTGIQTPGLRRFTVRDLIPGGTTDTNAILYLQESAFTNAAAPVKEGLAKPESALTFTSATAPVRKIAHWLPVSEEMLEDFSGIRSYIDTRLRYGLDLTEEDQLLNGNGVDPQILGILQTPGLAAAVARGADSNFDAILKQISAIATASLFVPDGVVVNPANWLSMQLAKNAQGNYLGSGPWQAPTVAMVWGLPVAQTPAIVANTALVGAFAMGAQIFRKGGVRVEATNSHQDFFVKNLVAIRAEERLALAVYRPGAFGTVTGLS